MHDQGRWAAPVAATALLWLCFELSALLFPSVFWTALEHEPGAVALDAELPVESASR